MSNAEILIRQYVAGVKMVKNAAQKCPHELWEESGGKKGPVYPFWSVAYHALFFTHLYASDSIESFKPWKHHYEKAESLESSSDHQAFSPDQIISYTGTLTRFLRSAVPAQDLEGPSGIPWWKEFTKLEMHIYNIRHLQHHAGQLVDRLRNSAGVDIDWVGKA